jgi:quercetin dioxygenase-like cupin family protein
MALTHAAPGSVIDVRPLGERLADTKTHAVLKTASLELMRVVLLAGKSLPPHSVPGEITVLCVEGRAWLRAGTGDHLLSAGDLVLLPGGDRHSVEAVEDSSLLVTVLLPQAGVSASGATAAR